MNPAKQVRSTSVSSIDVPASKSIHPSEDPRVADALDSYLADLACGLNPSRAEFLAHHPEIADQLAECLDGLEFLHAAGLEFSPGSTEIPLEESLEPSTRLGDYRIVREIGRGGMGVVYEAEQISLGRRVALKVLPFSAAIDPKQKQRFRVESQAAAHLHHPHIVPIFAVGQHQGVPYYAMQYIQGQTLAAMIADVRRFGASRKGQGFLKSYDTSTEGDELVPPTETLAPLSSSLGAVALSEGTGCRRGMAYHRAIARLGIEAADALEHAHGLGVLHRDIKPANLLIDLNHKLWVTDFGLARFRDDPGVTCTGDLLGTLRYMSPEQVHARRGIVDQRADVYALGATLFEAVTLRPAFGGRDRQELLQRILLEDPVAPRKIDPTIPRDLETILLKALAKEPSRRYTTAQEMADDLRNFLEDKPILACRPSRLDRAVRLVRRHRAVVATAASVLVIAALIASLLVWSEQRKNWEYFTKTNQGVDVALKASDAVTMRALATVTNLRGGEVKEEDRQFFETAKSFYEQLRVLLRNESDPRRKETLAKAHFGLGLTKKFLHIAGSEADFLSSIQTYEQLLVSGPAQSETLAGLSNALYYLAVLYAGQDRMPMADRVYDRLIQVRKDMLAHSPENLEYRECLAANMSVWAMIRAELGQSEDADRTLVEAVGLSPNSAEALNNLAWLLVSDPLRAPHDPQRAEKYARRAVELEPTDWRLWNTLSLTLARMGDDSGARAATMKSIALHHGETADDLFILAFLAWKRGDQAQADGYAKRANEWMEDHPSNADLHRLREEVMALVESGSPKVQQEHRPLPRKLLPRITEPSPIP